MLIIRGKWRAFLIWFSSGKIYNWKNILDIKGFFFCCSWDKNVVIRFPYKKYKLLTSSNLFLHQVIKE